MLFIFLKIGSFGIMTYFVHEGLRDIETITLLCLLQLLKHCGIKKCTPKAFMSILEKENVNNDKHERNNENVESDISKEIINSHRKTLTRKEKSSF
jgi:hypothetical protein